MTLGTVLRAVLRTGPRAGLLSAQCFAQRNVTTVGKSLVRVGTVADCCTVPVATAAAAAGGYRRGGCGGRRRGSRSRDCRCRRCVVGRRVARRAVARGRRIRFSFDDHLRTFADHALIVRDHESGIFLLRNAHVVARVGFLHYMPRSCRVNKRSRFGSVLTFCISEGNVDS